LITDISPDRTIANGNVTILGNVTTAKDQTYISNVIQLNGGATFTSTGNGSIEFIPGLTLAGSPAISAIGTLPVNIALNGGTLKGLAGSGVNYNLTNTPIVIPAQLPLTTERKAISLEEVREGIASSVLMSSMINPIQGTLVRGAREANGSVTIKNPDDSCDVNEEECLKPQTL